MDLNTFIQFSDMNAFLVFSLLTTVSLSGGAAGDQLRIYDGKIAENPLAPIVSIKDDRYKHICGGTIISPRWVLTAAHCVSNYTNLVVLAGAVDNSRLEITSQLVQVERVVVHDDFDGANPDNMENDLALLFLKESLTFNQYVNCIPLMSGNVLEEASKQNSNSFIAGWGATEDAYASKKLKFATVTVLNPAVCLQDIPESCHHFNPESQICTGALEGVKTGAGLEDDGGPLIVNCQLAGVINHGEHDPWTEPDACHKSTIYTSVPYYLDWIAGITGLENLRLAAVTESPEESAESPEETALFQVEITLSPVEDSEGGSTGAQRYDFSYRFRWFPSEYHSSWNDDNDGTIVSSSDEFGYEQKDQQYQIQYGLDIIVILEFSCERSDEEFRITRETPVKLRSSIKTR